MSTRLRKCIDITPNGVLRPGFPQDYRVYRLQPWFPRLLATTTHIRFWADWPSLQPSGQIAFGDPANPDHHKLTGLDEQIRLANQDGLRVVVMPYRYPTWVNETDHLGVFSDENALFMPGDRVAASTWLTWFNNRADVARRDTMIRRSMKNLEYRLPADGHGPGSRWAGYATALFDRYVANGDQHGYADYFEVVNEPQQQLWPQRTPSARASDPAGQFEVEGSVMTLQREVAQMIATVDRISRRYYSHVRLLAPSTSDTDTRSIPRRVTIAVNSSAAQMAEPFVPALLDELDRIRFRASNRWIWSYHNYNDMETGGDRVTALREAIRDRWNGRQDDDGPMLFATEGGIRLASMARQLGVDNDAANATAIRARQAEILARAFEAHRQPTGVGAGVGMLTQYTLQADPNFDCGLRESGGDERPAFGTWCDLRERVPRGRGHGRPADLAPA